ncbi:hypothetical protein [Corynebacterium cystitidis]|uniref:hypothetical protein n=1 Tax=Corynebacterium cystitidis TaxID=35757 RepID=UPI00211EF88C|nr:hypothetical protein [Corynebacterium cystitidis]
MLEVRKGLEIVIQCLYTHVLGVSPTHINLNENLKDLEGEIATDLWKKFDQARRHANQAMHSGDYELKVDNVYFCLKTLDEGIELLRTFS